MALDPLYFPLTRDQVHGWLDDYTGTIDENDLDFRAYLDSEVTALNLPDRMVNTVGSDGLPDETDIVDMILMDLTSYA